MAVKPGAKIRKIFSRRPFGQGLVETALLFPVLLIVLSGLIEFGFLLNEYLAIQDAARNAARYASDGLFDSRDNNYDCDTTRDFYRQTACLVNRELTNERPEIKLDFEAGDDVIISAISVGESGVVARFPAVYGDSGWSAALDSLHTRNQVSGFSSSAINARLDSSAPNTGLVLVEIYYHYHQKLKLPWITAFLSDPVLLHAYTLMPLVSAEPTPTPGP